MRKLLLFCCCISVALVSQAQEGKMIQSLAKGFVPQTVGETIGSNLVDKAALTTLNTPLQATTAVGNLNERILRVAGTVLPPLATPSFKGLPDNLKSTLTIESLNQTRAGIARLSQTANLKFIQAENHDYITPRQQNTLRAYRDNLQLFDELTQELLDQVSHKTSITPAMAEVRIGKIWEQQNVLKQLETDPLLYESDKKLILSMNENLSYFRHYYSTLAGNPSALP